MLMRLAKFPRTLVLVLKLTILADFRLDLTDLFEKNESDRKSSRFYQNSSRILENWGI